MWRIITAGLKGFEKLVARQKKGTKIHRPAAEGAVSRNRAKLLGKTKWFKPRTTQDQEPRTTQESGRQPFHGRPGWRRKEENGTTRQANLMETTAVLFIEQTPKGELANRFRQAEVSLAEITGFKIKIVEENWQSCEKHSDANQP